jgi:hypothetical protein
MAFRGGECTVLAGLLALGITSAAAGGDGKSFKLQHPAPRCGDSFSIEQKTSFVLARKGGAEKGHIETRSSYRVKVVGTEGAKFVTRFELDPTVTTTDQGAGSTPETSTEAGRTTEAVIDASELSLVPVPAGVKSNPSEGLGVLGSKDAVSLGDTWTAERTLAVAPGLAVPLKATYSIASVEKDPRGKDLLKVTLRSQGSATVQESGGVKLHVTGEGEALFDPERADRPVEVRLAYRFVTSGGEGADSETRTETTISTRELASVASPSSASNSQEKSR